MCEIITGFVLFALIIMIAVFSVRRAIERDKNDKQDV